MRQLYPEDYSYLSMSIFDLTQAGIGIFSVGVLAYLIPKFLKFMERQEENFRQTINNHLKENVEADRILTLTIKELLDYLKAWNGKQK